MTSPLYRDPVSDGATDPVLVYNEIEAVWWMLYTSRRATAPSRGVGWVHGSDIGVASSPDGGGTWSYRGTLDLAHEFGTNTFWAPEVLRGPDGYHMYVSYIRGVPETWAGHDRHIHHYTSPDLVSWTHVGPLALSSDRVIDAAVHQLPSGGHRLWYKDEADDSTTWCADSDDLFDWRDPRRVLQTPNGHEGPNVFQFRGWYWLVVDSWDGQLAFRSRDLEHWAAAGRILSSASARDGRRDDDLGPGYHCDVVVDGDEAYVIYFTHPDREDDRVSADSRRSSVLAAQLDCRDGELLCDRSAEVRLALSPEART